MLFKNVYGFNCVRDILSNFEYVLSKQEKLSGAHISWHKGNYHSDPLEVPYSPNQFLGWDFFFAVSYSKPALGQDIV